MCVPADDRAIVARGSVVVVTPADIVVMYRSVVGRLAREGALRVSSVETVFEDRRDRAVGGRTDVVAAPAGRFDARSTVALHQADDAEHERKPCSGCGLAFMIASNSAVVAGPTLSASFIILAVVHSA